MPTARPMSLGMVGLGRMGANIVGRVMRAGHRAVVFDLDPAPVQRLAEQGATGVDSLSDLAAALEAPRVVWVMLPAASTEQAIADLAAVLAPGDTIIDGGNTHYVDDIRRAAELRERGLHHIDCGTSGGIWGLERGYCLMIGGAEEPVGRLEPLFAAIAPGVGAAARTAGRSGPTQPGEAGYLHCGPSGSGHFVKMVHNGIEYGLMAAYAEGFNVLANAAIGTHLRSSDAETAPLAHPEHYTYELDLSAISELWRRGSVVGSWLLDLTAAALGPSPDLAQFSGRVSDSGEGRWAAAAAIEMGVPVPVLTAALQSRFDSQGGSRFANKLLSAMRREFGGHEERPG